MGAEGREPGRRHPDGHCSNCGYALTGRFCVHCGQDASRTISSVPRFVRRLIAESTDLDGPVWRTLRILLRHPGRLTREYAQGRFRSQVSPLRPYLLMAALYFFLLPIWGEWTVGEAVPGSASRSFRVNFPHRSALGLMVPGWAAMVHLQLLDRRVFFEEAFAFSAHFHVAFMIGFASMGAVAALLSLVGTVQVAMAAPMALLLLAIPTYTYRALREAFGVGRLRAVLSTGASLGGYGVAMELLERMI